MNNYEMFLHIMETAKRHGYQWNPLREYVGTVKGNITDERHVPILFRASFLKSLYGGQWRKVGHEALDVRFDGKSVLEYHVRKIAELKIK